jgi:glycosyltransferase involved in cell wall biosynthesis
MSETSARRAVIVLANSPWHAQWRRKQRLYSRLAALRPVYTIDPPFSPLDFLRGTKSFTTCMGSSVHVTTEPCGVRRVTGHPGIPGERFAGRIQFANAMRHRRWLKLRLCALMRDEALREPVVVCYEPLLYPVRELVPVGTFVYDVLDDYAALHPSRALRPKLDRAMRSLAAECDLTLVPNEALAQRLRADARRIELLPHGVDAARFRPGAHAGSRFASLAETRGVKAVFHGTLNTRVDRELLAALLAAGMTLVLAGENGWSRAAFRRLHAQGDLRYFGLLDCTEVAALVAACDVGLLPYNRSPGMEGVGTLKLLEFYAAGLPVVASAPVAAAWHTPALQIAEDPRAFVAAVHHAATLGAVERAAGFEIARANTWDARVRQLDAWLEE